MRTEDEAPAAPQVIALAEVTAAMETVGVTEEARWGGNAANPAAARRPGPLLAPPPALPPPIPAVSA